VNVLSRLASLSRSPAAVYLAAVVLSRAGAFLLIPLYTRRLTLEEYGQYALFLTLLAFLSTFMSAGLLSAIPKAYFSEEDRAEGKRRAAEVSRWLALISLGMTGILLIGVECFAVARYALAARAGRAGSFDDQYTQIAIDRLQAYGDERIAECIAEAQAADATFQGYSPGEFARSPRGKPLEIRPGIAPPAISKEND